jgi:hypothetical protein
MNVAKYPQVARAIKRIFSKITRCGGFVIYAGFEKDRATALDSRGLYGGVLRRLLLKTHRACCATDSKFLVLLDDNDRTFSREVILRKAQQVMFGQDRCRSLIETPLQIESLIYPSLQCADWICGLLGRYAAFKFSPLEFSDFSWSEQLFGIDLARTARYSQLLTVEQRQRQRLSAEARTIAARDLTGRIAINVAVAEMIIERPAADDKG